ncbi:MAG: hypothetical protein AB7T49_17765 [Oligoflexales bacterium]
MRRTLSILLVPLVFFCCKHSAHSKSMSGQSDSDIGALDGCYPSRLLRLVVSGVENVDEAKKVCLKKSQSGLSITFAPSESGPETSITFDTVKSCDNHCWEVENESLLIRITDAQADILNLTAYRRETSSEAHLIMKKQNKVHSADFPFVGCFVTSMPTKEGGGVAEANDAKEICIDTWGTELAMIDFKKNSGSSTSLEFGGVNTCADQDCWSFQNEDVEIWFQQEEGNTKLSAVAENGERKVVYALEKKE